MKGLPKSYIRKYGISKKAWSEYRKSKKSKSRASGVRHVRMTLKPKTKTKTKRRRKYMPRRKRKIRKKRFTIPLAPVLGLAAGLAEPIQKAMGGDVQGAINVATHHYTGYSVERGQFEIDGLKHGIVPLIIGLLVHKFVGGAPLNANRMLARAGVPVVRI